MTQAWVTFILGHTTFCPVNVSISLELYFLKRIPNITSGKPCVQQQTTYQTSRFKQRAIRTSKAAAAAAQSAASHMLIYGTTYFTTLENIVKVLRIYQTKI